MRSVTAIALIITACHLAGCHKHNAASHLVFSGHLTSSFQPTGGTFGHPTLYNSEATVNPAGSAGMTITFTLHPNGDPVNGATGFTQGTGTPFDATLLGTTVTVSSQPFTVTIYTSQSSTSSECQLSGTGTLSGKQLQLQLSGVQSNGTITYFFSGSQ